MKNKIKKIDLSNFEINNKPNTILPGIGIKLGKTLKRKGFPLASCVLGQFLLLKCIFDLFLIWLNGYGANSYQIKRCYNYLSNWCEIKIFQKKCHRK